MNNVRLIEVGDVPVWIGKHGHETSPRLAFGLRRKLNASINPFGISLLKVNGTKPYAGVATGKVVLRLTHLGQTYAYRACIKRRVTMLFVSEL
jgi:hypothetical protein